MRKGESRKDSGSVAGRSEADRPGEVSRTVSKPKMPAGKPGKRRSKDVSTETTASFDRERLQDVLASHQRWLASEKAEGEKADLKGANLAGFALEGADLREADLSETNLQNAKLDKANLEETDLHQADLSGASLAGSRLLKTNFREAVLDGANLTGATGLLAGQFAGAALARAKLPESISKFEGVSVADDTSKVAQNLFITLLLVCAYTWLTIATTVDVKLITNSASSTLPIVGASIPIVTFYVVTPLILVVLYLHFNIYLQRFWEGLAELPAVFPDGRSLDRRVSPWLLNGLVRSGLRLLVDRPLPLLGLQLLTSMLLAWWVVPLTLFLIWLRYLSAHDLLITSLHVLLLAISIGAGITLHRLAMATLRGEREASSRRWQLWKRVRVQNYAAAILVFFLFAFLSYGVIWGVKSYLPPHFYIEEGPENDEVTRREYQSTRLERWAPKLLSMLGSDPFPDFRNEEVSTKPVNWSGLKDDELDYVKGARLYGKYLPFLLADNAFLVRATLNFCDLQRAEFEGADLRKANLQYSDLKWANLRDAKLGRADLDYADLRKALLWSADLTGATLKNSKLDGAILLGARLSGATMQNATLSWANLNFADLSNANLQGAKFDHTSVSLTTFRGANLSFVDLSSIEYDTGNDFEGSNLANARLPHTFTFAKLGGADLSNADLSGVDLSYSTFTGAKLERANFQGAKLLGADFRGADLTLALNLTEEQLKEANTDTTTKRPQTMSAKK